MWKVGRKEGKQVERDSMEESIFYKQRFSYRKPYELFKLLLPLLKLSQYIEKLKLSSYSSVLKCLDILLESAATIWCYMGAETSLEKAATSLGAGPCCTVSAFSSSTSSTAHWVKLGENSAGLLERELKARQ